MAEREIVKGVFSVGALDPERRLFDELIPLPNGTSYNSYLIIGSEKTALIDTVDPSKFAELNDNLSRIGVKKIDYIILSGDNQFSYYNEPQDMRKALRYMQVPDSVLVMDYAGFRTFDSVIRCFKVFGQTKFTLISQEFQNKRGIYIARKEGLDVVGYNAGDVDFRMGIQTSVREVLARVNVVLDIYLFHTQPKFLGKKIKL